MKLVFPLQHVLWCHGNRVPASCWWKRNPALEDVVGYWVYMKGGNFPSFLFFLNIRKKRHWPPPLIAGMPLVCAEGPWQKELCKRALKIPKWLWSAHKGGQRMHCRTKASPGPSTLAWSDESERTHERGLNLRPWRHHLTPHWAKQKERTSGIQRILRGPQNNQDLLTTLNIHRPWLIWETHACFSVQHPPSLFIILSA